MRETLEELFDYKDLPKSMIEDLVERFPSTKVLHNGTYMCGIFTFKDLERLLTRVKRYRIRSPVYPEFPDTIMKLLFTRKPDSKAELSHLVLLPLIETIKISSHLTEDIPEIKRLLRE